MEQICVSFVMKNKRKTNTMKNSIEYWTSHSQTSTCRLLLQLEDPWNTLAPCYRLCTEILLLIFCFYQKNARKYRTNNTSGKNKSFSSDFLLCTQKTYSLGKQMYLDHIFSFHWEKTCLKQFTTILKYICHLFFQFPLVFFICETMSMGGVFCPV